MCKAITFSLLVEIILFDVRIIDVRKGSRVHFRHDLKAGTYVIGLVCNAMMLCISVIRTNQRKGVKVKHRHF